jgi:hypothetical protein
MPLVTFKSGVVTVGQYLERMQGSMPMWRPVLDTGEVTRALLFQMVFRDVMAGRAVELGLDKEEDFSKRFKQAVESQIARLSKTRILSTVQPDTAAAAAYFRAHPEEFVLPAAAHLFEINRLTEAEILQLKKTIRNKSQFTAGASQFTARAHLRPSGGEVGWVEQHEFPELFTAASKIQPGEMAGPVALADGSFSLIYLEGRRAARRRRYDEVRNELVKKVWTQAVDSAFAAWMEEQQKRIKVATYPDVLEKTIDRTYYTKRKEWQEKVKDGSG